MWINERLAVLEDIKGAVSCNHTQFRSRCSAKTSIQPVSYGYAYDLASTCTQCHIGILKSLLECWFHLIRMEKEMSSALVELKILDSQDSL